MNDNIQLTELFGQLCQAWTDGDAQAYGACFTADADYVSFDGAWARGRDPMVESHDRLFRGVLTGSTLVGEIESIRFVGPDVALLHATGSVLVAWRSTLPKSRLSRQTLVAVRTEDGWRFAALQNTRVRPVRVPAPDSLPARMARLLVRVASAFRLGRTRQSKSSAAAA
ncbi:SgcJ/EcaC family oxidoreductase [Amycolatopsis palatopharyngis]|uniref:SgcJ/EcaC family oxidoreductase n=1 Tax=Amycolatopsis palatopharyngis TaxID=187982 RepID=UPI000E27F473|nr:SgcJ/EcaC family oxidoreductase [Amycolatopsis palatopharyngis]